MENVSSYALIGFPESLGTAFVLVWLSLSLAPWLGGTELGPLKVPRFTTAINRWLRIAGPIGFFLFSFGFIKIWPPMASASLASSPLPTMSEYLDSFFNESAKRIQLPGELLVLNELEARGLRETLGGTKWDGGANWGVVSFDKAGRIATFTNEADRSPGKILVQGAPMGTAPIIVGEWYQADKQSGRLIFSLRYDDGGDELLYVMWGPAFSVESKWKQLH